MVRLLGRLIGSHLMVGLIDELDGGLDCST